ncbi:MAG: hypothetical protein ACW97P_07930 [Candidatus Hodarchaeales archaeon]
MKQSLILKTSFITVFFLCLAHSYILASEESVFEARDEKSQKAVSLTKLKIKLYDSDLGKESPNLKLLAQVADPINSKKKGTLVPSYKIVFVPDPNSWPDDTVNSYLVLFDESGSVVAFEETPSSESGDWSNTYTYYFDKKGTTIAFKRYSGFFMGCPASVSKETSVYYYDEKHQLIQKEYTLINEEGAPINPKKCDFMYRHEYKIYNNWNELANDIGILKFLKIAE